MKLIDEKGRLFGKFNIIDLLIVLIVLGGLLGVTYKLGYIKKLGSTNAPQKKTYVKFFVKDVIETTAQGAIASKGGIMREVSSNTEIGKIVDVKVEPYMNVASDASGKWVESEVPHKKQFYVTIEASTVQADGTVKLGSKEARAGASLEVKGPKFQATAYVAGVE